MNSQRLHPIIVISFLLIGAICADDYLTSPVVTNWGVSQRLLLLCALLGVLNILAIVA